jgi:hypothetical protein
MTQYPPPQGPMYPPPQAYPQPISPRTSGLAIASLVFSLLGCCPGAGLLGFLLGIGAMSSTKRPGVSGRGLAIAGMLIGLVATIAWIAIPYGLYVTMKAAFRQADTEINTFVDDFNKGNDKAIYDRAGSTLQAKVSQEEFHSTMNLVREKWGKAERISLWKMLTSGGVKGEQAGNAATISFPMQFDKVGVKKIRISFVQEQNQMKLTSLDFEGLTKLPKEGQAKTEPGASND